MTAKRLVITLGLHGSASTWVFNVARELLTHNFGADEVHACHLSHTHELPASRDRHIIGKTHGWPEIADMIRAEHAHVIISVRDPRDATLSLMQRFGMGFEASYRAIGRDCFCILQCRGIRLATLRYEGGFFKIPAAVKQIAQYLDLPATDDALARIFTAYETEAVRLFSAAVTSLPPAQLSGAGNFWFDRLTQITNAHIGDGCSGKWNAAFDSDQKALLTRFFQPFLTVFGYV